MTVKGKRQKLLVGQMLFPARRGTPGAQLVGKMALELSRRKQARAEQQEQWYSEQMDKQFKRHEAGVQRVQAKNRERVSV